MVLKQHGEQAPLFVVRRIGALAIEGDQAGVDTWKTIAAKMEQLMKGKEH